MKLEVGGVAIDVPKNAVEIVDDGSPGAPRWKTGRATSSLLREGRRPGGAPRLL